MIDVRCKYCGKLLAKAHLMDAAIKCTGCKKIFEYHIYNNQFVTSQYDPTNIKVLRYENDNDNVVSESERPMPI